MLRLRSSTRKRELHEYFGGDAVCGCYRCVDLVSDVFAAAEHEVNFGGHLFGCHAVAAVVALDFDEGIPVDVGGVGVGDVLALHSFSAIDFCDKEEGYIVIGDFVDADGLAFRADGAVDLASRAAAQSRCDGERERDGNKGGATVCRAPCF